jgi:hypothetical protein
VADVVHVAEMMAWNLGHLRFSDIINPSSALSDVQLQNHSSVALHLDPLIQLSDIVN